MVMNLTHTNKKTNAPLDEGWPVIAAATSAALFPPGSISQHFMLLTQNGH